MRIDVADSRELEDYAKASGFVSVAAYVEDLVRRDVARRQTLDRVANRTPTTPEERRRRFRETFECLPASEVADFDDSRESIYAGQ